MKEEKRVAERINQANNALHSISLPSEIPFVDVLTSFKQDAKGLISQ